VPSFDEVADGLRMPLVEAIETQRAVRRLLPDPVDDETVLTLLRLAVKAPTGGNHQNWEFVVVRDPDIKHQLARLNRQAWSVYRRLGARQARDEASRKIVDAVQWQADHFADIPVVVVACLRGVRVPFPSIAATSFYGSIYPSVQNLLLAARAAGLGEVGLLRLEGERGHVFAVGRGELVLVAVADAGVNIGLVRAEMLKAVEVLA
jgi:nitroreductase